MITIMKKVKLVFDEYDLNHSGIMDYLEFESMLRKRPAGLARVIAPDAIRAQAGHLTCTLFGSQDFCTGATRLCPGAGWPGCPQKYIDTICKAI